MAELLIRNCSVGCIKAIIFDKDGTLSNSEECLLELAKTRINFTENKFKNFKLNKIKIWLLRKLLIHIYGLKENAMPVLIANIITLSLNVSILILKLLFR